MKRTFATSIILAIALIITSGLASGQEKKTEKKVKVIVSDSGGEKVLIDTVFIGKDLKDSIVMKDANVVIIGDDAAAVPGAKGKIYVYTSTGKDLNHSSDESGTISWVSAEGDGQVKKIIIAGDEVISTGDNMNKTVYIRHAGKDENSEKASYVITRDGLKISVEGNDYEKVKQLVKEIEAKLDAMKQPAATEKNSGSKKAK
ncbi:MAG: hypothetical protein MUE32_07240 [Bacteroidales bacterium]|jgi:hypothetical protein|nr:hypothetical protein [Bacteroidales bacterium]